MKKLIRYLFSITIITFIFLLASCPDPFKLPDIDKPNFGEGFIVLNADISVGRTILPTTLQSNFLGYTLIFSSIDRDDVIYRENQCQFK